MRAASAWWSTTKRLTRRQLRALRCHYDEKNDCYVAPSDSTFFRVLGLIDPAHFEAIVAGWLLEQEIDQLERIAVDGKVLRGTGRGDGKPIALLSAVTHCLRTTIRSVQIAEKSNEIPAIKPLLAGKSRLLPVGERAAWWLERYLIESRPLFAHLPAETALFLSGYGTRFSPAYIGNWVAGLMKKAGVKIPGSSHLWRHSCATGMLEGGADIRYIQEPSGAR